jgi:type IV secretory pathway VirB10-like protein
MNETEDRERQEEPVGDWESRRARVDERRRRRAEVARRRRLLAGALAAVVAAIALVEEVTLVDGEEESREHVRTETVEEMRPRIVEVGTAPPPEPRPRPAPADEPDPEPAPPPPEPVETRAAPNVEEGGASWYDNPYGGHTAAHRSIPRGTTVTVTNLANGRSVEVRINDRGPFVDGRVIDLNRKAFAELAPPADGVIRVRVEW